MHPDNSLLPCSFVLHYYTWEYRHISITSRFLKALYHPCLSALAVKQNSIIIYCPPTWVGCFNFTGKEPAQGTSEIYLSHNRAVQYCYTAKEEEKIAPEKAESCLKWPWKRSWWHAVVERNSLFFLASAPQPLAWIKQYPFIGRLLQWMWMDLLVPSCLF